MLNDDSSWAEVVSSRTLAQPLRAYNLTVKDFHTYFVAANKNAAPVWVHNICLWSPTQKLDSVRNALGHWRKHRNGFPSLHSATQYVNYAKAFRLAPPPNTLQKVRPNGDIIMYHHQTNTFAVYASDGTPRTMFKPTPRSPSNPYGYNPQKYSSPLAYYNAQ